MSRRCFLMCIYITLVLIGIHTVIGNSAVTKLLPQLFKNMYVLSVSAKFCETHTLMYLCTDINIFLYLPVPSLNYVTMYNKYSGYTV